MNQPKPNDNVAQPRFKFGDKVTRKGYEPFEVDQIERCRVTSTYFYNDRDPEHLLELYQEPQKKKLYAWKSRDGAIFHVAGKDTGTEIFCRIGIDAQSFIRAPEYDLEYPDSL